MIEASLDDGVLTIASGKTWTISGEGGSVQLTIREENLYVHDLNVDSNDAHACARICSIARAKAKDLGFSQWYAFIDPANPRLLEPLIRIGFQMESIILRSNI